jgi:ribosomal protein L11 methyltransferase
VIDPGQAFGTGAHATTRLCLELLLGLEPAGPLLDVGCGSGVLAIAAAKLGFAPVTGIDHERESVAATTANAAANGVVIDVFRADLRRDPPPAAPTVMANLLEPLLLTLAQRLAALPQRLIAGGLLVEQVDSVAKAFAKRGLVERERRVAGEWGALLLAR